MQTGSSRCWCTRGSADAAPTRSRRRWRSCSWRGGREKAPAAICRKVAMAEDGPSTGSGQGGTIPVWGDGSGIRNYTYVDDLVEGICLLMQSDLEDSTNIGGEEYVTVAELVQTVIDVSGKDIRADSLSPTEYVEGPVGVTSFRAGAELQATFGCRNLRLPKARIHSLGWEARVSLQEGIGRTYAWIEEQVEALRRSKRTNTRKRI